MLGKRCQCSDRCDERRGDDFGRIVFPSHGVSVTLLAVEGDLDICVYCTEMAVENESLHLR